MWVVSFIFFVLWIFSVEFHLPWPLIILFFSMVVGFAAVAMMPQGDEKLDIDRD